MIQIHSLHSVLNLVQGNCPPRTETKLVNHMPSILIVYSYVGELLKRRCFDYTDTDVFDEKVTPSDILTEFSKLLVSNVIDIKLKSIELKSND